VLAPHFSGRNLLLDCAGKEENSGSGMCATAGFLEKPFRELMFVLGIPEKKNLGKGCVNPFQNFFHFRRDPTTFIAQAFFDFTAR